MRSTVAWTLVGVLLLLFACGSQGTDEQDSATDEGLDGVEVADATGEDAEEEDAGPVPAPDFALTDLNPNSPTYEDERRVSDEEGKVLLIYFANYT